MLQNPDVQEFSNHPLIVQLFLQAIGEIMSTTRRDATTIEVIPSAKRLVLSLRDVGYDFSHAVADLVDNSIAAKASRVEIDFRFAGEDSWVRIFDNGKGMSGSTITEAMRYGSEKTYESDDLGKFGLGLKTASMSQCRRLTVASRTDPNTRRIEVRMLDLDYIEDKNRWEVFNLGSDERSDHLIQPLYEQTGTVVLWEGLDRILNYRIPWGERARMRLYSEAERLEDHLAMVFHRFLSGEALRRKKLSIFVEGNKVEPWDPFARDESATEKLEGEEFDVLTSSGRGIVRYQPYVLPPKDRFSSDSKFEKLGGPARWNRQQGFYIYRADRMIQSGGWSRMRTADEHTKLARASLDFYSDLDDAFEINVAKVRVSLPSDLREQLQDHVEKLVRRARTIYDHKTSLPDTTKNRGAAGRTGTNAARKKVNSQDITPRTALEHAARLAGEEEALARIVRILRKKLPEVANELGW